MRMYTVSEIHITECMVDPWFISSVGADFCYPSSTKEDDAHKGKWVRVEPNLKTQVSYKSLVRPHSPTSFTTSREAPNEDCC